MDTALVCQKLIVVLQQIQTASHLDCPTLDGSTVPIGTLPEFDSKVWPVAITLLANDLKMDIPNDVNIFFDEATKRARTIDEAAAFVCGLQKSQEAAA